MPTTAWSVARPAIARPLGLFEGTSDAAGYTTTTLVDVDLESVYDIDDMLNGWYTFAVAGTNAGRSRRVSDYTADGGTLTNPGPVWTADAAARVFEVHRFNPIWLQEEFNQAKQTLFPYVSIVRDLSTLITGQRQHRYTLPSTVRYQPLSLLLSNRDVALSVSENQLTDGGFETWTNSTTLTNWTLAGTGSTVNQETQTTSPRNYAILQDTYSARIIVALNTVTTLLQSVDLAQSADVAAEGMEVNFSVWVYCLTASRVQATIRGTNVVSTPVLGTAHGGGGWERITVTANLNSAATGYDVGVAITSGAAIAVYVDEGICVVGQSEVADREWTPLTNWRWIAPAAGAANSFLEFDYRLPELRVIRIVGRDILSTVTADTDTVEIDGDQLDILYNETRRAIIARSLLDLPEPDRPYWQSRMAEYARLVTEAKGAGAKVRAVRQPLVFGAWQT